MKKSLFISLLGIILGSILIFSCSDDKSFEPGINTEAGSSMQVNTNSTDLANRINYIREDIEVVETSSASQSSAYSRVKANVEKANETYYWELLAEMPVLVHNGQTLSATQVEIFKDYAYVSYNAQADAFVGAVEIIELSKKDEPKSISIAYFDDIDINSITIDEKGSNTKMDIWLAGSRNVDGAVVIQLTSNKGVIQADNKIASLAKVFEEGISSSANSICKIDDYLYVTSGSSIGGITKLSTSDLSYINHVSFTSAKYVISNDPKKSANKVIVLSTGNAAKLRVFNTDLSEASSPFELGAITHANVVDTYSGKNTMQLSEDKSSVFIGMGSAGLKAYNISTGNEVHASSAGMLSNGNTNSVTTDDDFVYLANGADGLAIALYPETVSTEIAPIFTWDMDEGVASANFVIADDDYIFVAKGSGGVKILRRLKYGNHPGISASDEDGVPLAVIDTLPVCTNLLPKIFSSILPYSKDATVLHPEYFTNTIKNIILKEDATLYITFLDESAGYKNSLGYYTYPKGEVPTSIDDITNKGIIFQNASAVNSGGGLVKGNSMKLIGPFDENTVVGFYLIANAWNARTQSVTDGYFTQYTNPSFNKNGNTQTVTFYEEACKTLVIGFEDISLPGGDKDYNDAIFQVTSVPANAIDVEQYVHITDE